MVQAEERSETPQFRGENLISTRLLIHHVRFGALWFSLNSLRLWTGMCQVARLRSSSELSSPAFRGGLQAKPTKTPHQAHRALSGQDPAKQKAAIFLVLLSIFWLRCSKPILAEPVKSCRSLRKSQRDLCREFPGPRGVRLDWIWQTPTRNRVPKRNFVEDSRSRNDWQCLLRSFRATYDAGESPSESADQRAQDRGRI